MIFEQLSGNLIQGLVLGAVYGMATMGLSPIFAIPVAFIVGMGLGLIFYYTAIKRLIKAPELATLLATFAIGVLLEELIKLIFGSEFRGYNWTVGKLNLGMTVLPLSKLYAAIGSALIAVILYLWFNKTRAGSAMRSVVEDSEGARVCGVNVGGAYAWSFALGIGLTVASGVLLTMFIPVGINPYMGGGYTLKAFVIAVLGGLSSPYGAFFGGLVFGLLENGSYTLFALIPGIEPFALTRFFSFVILLAILLIKPTGILSKK
jgi:branched-chain amino acid transport system permease protein